MKKGFTLLELIVVIIILGVLATLGMQQYFRAVEKSRSAEAKQVLGQLRETAAGYYTENNTLATFNEVAAGIGNSLELIPSINDACRSSNYFRYFPINVGVNHVTFQATRCAQGTGKTPGFAAGTDTITLVANFGPGASDLWSYSLVYQ